MMSMNVENLVPQLDYFATQKARRPERHARPPLKARIIAPVGKYGSIVVPVSHTNGGFDAIAKCGPQEDLTTLGVAAVKETLEKAGVTDASGMCMLVLPAGAGHQLTPPIGYSIARQLGITPDSIKGEDLGCAGPILAIEEAAALVETKRYRKV